MVPFPFSPLTALAPCQEGRLCCPVAPPALGRPEGCSPNWCSYFPFFRPNPKPQTPNPQPQRRAVPPTVLMTSPGVWLEGLSLQEPQGSVPLLFHPTPPSVRAPPQRLPTRGLFLPRSHPGGEVGVVETPHHTFATALLATLFHCKCKVIHLWCCFCGPIYIIVSGESVLRVEKSKTNIWNTDSLKTVVS